MRQLAFGLFSLLAGIGLLAQQPQLRIVVLEGENAVNIIQQKTAVKALVEVRDQNNLPVAGASVTFAVTGKGGATVAGAQTFTVSTNAAGQAALGGMTPASSGGLQISVNASMNGVTATTTITQSVVATAAAAAAAAGVGAGAGAAGAAGGGLGTGAIVGIVGGAVAVGGGIVVAGAGDDSNDGTGDGGPGGQGSTPLPACVFAASPTILTVPFEGGTYTIAVTMTPASCANPEWPVTNIPSFVTATPTSGRGSGAVMITVAPFTPTATFPARSDAISVAGTVVHIHQPRAVTALARR